MEIWGYGDMGIWGYWNTRIWGYEDMGISEYGIWGYGGLWNYVGFGIFKIMRAGNKSFTA